MKRKRFDDSVRENPDLMRRYLVLSGCLLMAGCTLPRRDRGSGSSPATGSTRPHVANLVTVERDVRVKRNGRGIRVTAGMKLYDGDTINTDSDSYARVRFRDGDEVWLDYRTRVRIGSLDISFGRVFAVVKGIFTIDSEFVTAGTEGTEFSVTVNRPNRGDYSVAVKRGVVRCSSPRRRWKAVRVTRGEMLFSEKHIQPEKLRLRGPQKKREFSWVKRLSRGPEPIKKPVKEPVKKEPILY